MPNRIHDGSSPLLVTHKLPETSAGLLIVAFILVALTRAQAAPFSVIDLGTLGGTGTQVRAINNSTQAVGASFTSANSYDHAFAYHNGSMVNLGTLGTGSGSLALAVNNLGTAAGVSYTDGANDRRAFVFSNGQMTPVNPFGASASESQARDINDSGTIVGFVDSRAYRYHNGVTTDLGSLGGSFSAAYGINNSGVIVGGSVLTSNVAQHAFVYDNGQMSDLGTLGGTTSYASAINDSGAIVGISQTLQRLPGNGNQANHAFFYDAGQMYDMGTLLGDDESQANAINFAGTVVGSSYHTNAMGHFIQKAFIYSGGVMTNLNTLIVDANVRLTSAHGINDLGQIVAEGVYLDRPQYTRSFLLTPSSTPTVPDTSRTAFLLVPAMAALVLLRARSRFLPKHDRP